MELVGKSVKKKFKGLGVFKGTVESYDPSSGFFEVKYEDGDFEKLGFSDVAALVGEDKEAAAAAAGHVDPKPRLGRKPKKRRRAELKKPESGGESGNSRVVEANGNLDMNRNVDLNDGFGGDSRENVDLNETLEKGSGIVENFERGGF
ncbi:PHD-FINGER AND DNA BINDING DOMAIN-CONTAINING PROTEIN [Salix purpurea]|uniref:PHD-FINGER AND DNA BINDING DOMAIN-CONTAINING PROTEIN n=1 Tax=Salix purpurea TaxID=77065 RepID=A0A9Q0VV99_SALPP|nr:PHD-FINGER AND DNA BINDING DOMAIN-CONTAINING PROTEIN [Salix purpurea]